MNTYMQLLRAKTAFQRMQKCEKTLRDSQNMRQIAACWEVGSASMGTFQDALTILEGFDPTLPAIQEWKGWGQVAKDRYIPDAAIKLIRGKLCSGSFGISFHEFYSVPGKGCAE